MARASGSNSCAPNSRSAARDPGLCLRQRIVLSRVSPARSGDAPPHQRSRSAAVRVPVDRGEPPPGSLAPPRPPPGPIGGAGIYRHRDGAEQEAAHARRARPAGLTDGREAGSLRRRMNIVPPFLRWGQRSRDSHAQAVLPPTIYEGNDAPRGSLQAQTLTREPQWPHSTSVRPQLSDLNPLGSEPRAFRMSVLRTPGGLITSLANRRHLTYEAADVTISYEAMLALDENNPRRGVKTRVLDKMATERATVGDLELECNICFEQFTAGVKVMRLPCDHRFCSACIRRWLADHRTCPVCRFEFPDSQTRLVKS